MPTQMTIYCDTLDPSAFDLKIMLQKVWTLKSNGMRLRIICELRIIGVWCDHVQHNRINIKSNIRLPKLLRIQFVCVELGMGSNSISRSFDFLFSSKNLYLTFHQLPVPVYHHLRHWLFFGNLLKKSEKYKSSNSAWVFDRTEIFPANSPK